MHGVILIAFLAFSASAQLFETLKVEQCSSFDNPTWDYSNQTFTEERDQTWNNLQDSYAEMFYFLSRNSGSGNSIVKASSPGSPMLIVMIILSFLSFIFFFVWCFGFCHKVNNPFCENLLVIINCTLFWTFVALYITLLVFLGYAVSYFQSSLCTFYYVPSYFQFGQKAVPNSLGPYMGYYTLNRTAIAFAQEFATWGSAVRTVLTPAQLAAANPTQEIGAMLNSLGTFRATNMVKLITATDGGKKYSNIVRNYDPKYLNPAIQRSADLVERAGLDLQAALQVMVNYQEAPATRADFRTQMVNHVRDQIVFGTYFNGTWHLFVERLHKYDRWGLAAVWAIFAIGLAMIALLGTVCFVIFMICCYRRCLNCIRFSKILVTTSAFCLIGWFIVCLIMLVGVTILAGHCFMLKNVNTYPANYTILDMMGIYTPEPVKMVWRHCTDYAENDDISILAANNRINSPRVQDFYTVMDGLTSYQRFITDTVDTSTNGYTRTAANYAQIRDGFAYDSPDLNSTLIQLNQAVSCSGVSYALKTGACPQNGAVCRGIFDSSSLPSSNCYSANNTLVVPLFTNMRNHIIDVDQLFGQMTKDLSDATTAGAPLRTYNEAKAKVAAMNQHYTALRNVFPNSMSEFAGLNETFSRTLSCRGLIRQMRNAENTICFRAQRYSYIYMVISCVAGMILFFLMWFLCGALREQESLVRHLPAVPLAPTIDPKPSAISNHPSVPVYQFDDFEVAPVY